MSGCAYKKVSMAQEIMAGYRQDCFDALEVALEYATELKELCDMGEDVGVDEWLALYMYLEISTIRIEKFARKLLQKAEGEEGCNYERDKEDADVSRLGCCGSVS